MKIHKISSKELTFKQVNEILTKGYKLELSADAIKRIQKCRDYLDKKMENPEKPIYGVTTGFGSLCDHSISKEDLSTLQKNLVMSHACGTGEMVPEEIIRLMLLLKVQSLSYGNSGVQVVTVQRLIDFFNNDVLPVVYNQGSLGASGDLAPLANLMLPLLGLGEVHFEGKIVPAEKVLKKFDQISKHIGEPGDGKVKPKMESVDVPAQTPGLIDESMSMLLKYVVTPLELKKQNGETLTPDEEKDLANAKAKLAKVYGEPATV
jgi:histidine ammonia-lyase